eukprot:SAG31_NODE_2286_length_6006_cov_4.245810_1_plen_343_part_10
MLALFETPDEQNGVAVVIAQVLRDMRDTSAAASGSAILEVSFVHNTSTTIRCGHRKRLIDILMKDCGRRVMQETCNGDELASLISELRKNSAQISTACHMSRREAFALGEAGIEANINRAVREPLEISFIRLVAPPPKKLEQHRRFRDGSIVLIDGLSSAEGQRLNGLRAIVLGWDSAAGRLVVRMRGPPPTIERRVKPANLTVIDIKAKDDPVEDIRYKLHRQEFLDQRSRDHFASLRNSVVLGQEAEKQAGCDGNSLPVQRLYDLPLWTGGSLEGVSSCLRTLVEKQCRKDGESAALGVSANSDLRDSINSMTQYYLDGHGAFIVMPSKHEGAAIRSTGAA